MELKAIDNSRVVYLTHVRRPAGQTFLPAAMQALLDRYHFQKFPNATELLSETLLFQQGVFDGVGINEFGIYRDGFLVGTSANTTILEQFIDDLLAWAESALGLVRTDIPPRETHYESALIVSMEIDAGASFPWIKEFSDSLTKYQAAYGLKPFEFSFGALAVATDEMASVGRKPIPFTIARRVGVPFEANLYYATAPLKTDDHLEALADLERMLA